MFARLIRVVPVIRVFAVSTVVASVWGCAASITPMKPRVQLPPTPVASPPAAPVPAPPATGAQAPPAPTADSERVAADTDSATVLPSIIGSRGRQERQEHPLQDSRQEHRPQSDLAVRVALATEQRSVQLSASGAWDLYDRTGEHFLAHVGGGESWTVEPCGEVLCAGSDRGTRTPPVQGPLVARPADESSVLSYNGRRYRGEILVLRGDGGVAVVNRLSVESYLRGVVPLEIGPDRTSDEEAAVEAQAVAARSYAYTHLDESRPYDLTATVMDQVYGGVDAERPVADAAIDATRGLVLWYDGKVVSAPYHANSGGVTAAASEVWRSHDEPYLVPVSDRIPGSDHYYCEQSPKFRWTREYDAAALTAVLDRYLRKYADVPPGGVGRVLGVLETGRTQSGRVAGLTFVTDHGRFTVRGNEIRFVLRSPVGDVLPSTLFTIDAEGGDSGVLRRLTLRGTGNGHGVGMDQWGAIGRARAGQDYQTILHTYYPGTTVGPIA